jgi:hypothetical protein
MFLMYAPCRDQEEEPSMRTIIVAVAVVAGLGIAGPAFAADDSGPIRETSIKSLSFQYEDGQVCHNFKIVVNGETVVDDVGCQP